jgi:hypothetical protein
MSSLFKGYGVGKNENILELDYGAKTTQLTGR